MDTASTQVNSPSPETRSNRSNEAHDEVEHIIISLTHYGNEYAVPYRTWRKHQGYQDEDNEVWLQEIERRENTMRDIMNMAAKLALMCHEKIEKYDSVLEKFKQFADDQKNAIETLQQSYQLEFTTRERCEKLVEELEVKLDFSNKRVSTLEIELRKNASAEAARQEESEARIRDLTRESEEMRDVIARLRNENKELREDCELKRKMISKLEEHNESQNMTVQELRRTVTNLNTKLTDAKEQYIQTKDLYEKLQEDLKTAFSLNATHTNTHHSESDNRRRSVQLSPPISALEQSSPDVVKKDRSRGHTPPKNWELKEAIRNDMEEFSIGDFDHRRISPMAQFADALSTQGDSNHDEIESRRGRSHSQQQLRRRDPFEEFCVMLCQCAKLNSRQLQKVYLLDTSSFYSELLREHLPFNEWYDWIFKRLHEKIVSQTIISGLRSGSSNNIRGSQL
eukprot:TRINITY_DN1477_c0_g1_i2.p1 TRINITY_DN1477_c0_g1~~TRINITY_DN1477_c0_g1_i2.p1  ORF type:complete len:453 (-),score=44.63 TRINITY_DN1477_c0_g1_i2:252-1610(-)